MRAAHAPTLTHSSGQDGGLQTPVAILSLPMLTLTLSIIPLYVIITHRRYFDAVIHVTIGPNTGFRMRERGHTGIHGALVTFHIRRYDHTA
jgi:hypothetical protein